MDWFLYDNDLRHERVNYYKASGETLTEIKAYTIFIKFILVFRGREIFLYMGF